MFSTGRSKHYPRLGEFIERRVQASREGDAALGVVGGVVGIVAGVLGGIFGVLAGMGVVSASPQVIATIVVALNLGVWLAIGGFWLAAKRRRAERRPRRHQRQAEATLAQMHYALYRRRLHRDLDPVAGTLLEEAARIYLRLRQTLEGPFWSGRDLPEHWKTVRGQALRASDEAMDEIVVILADCLKTGRAQSGVFELVEQVVDSIKGGTIPAADGTPSGFAQAREIAAGLGKLAGEIETATEQVVREESVAADFSSLNSIDLCLGELRTVRQADEEMRENLRS